jgi:hypothetical protein
LIVPASPVSTAARRHRRRTGISEKPGHVESTRRRRALVALGKLFGSAARDLVQSWFLIGDGHPSRTATRPVERPDPAAWDAAPCTSAIDVDALPLVVGVYCSSAVEATAPRADIVNSVTPLSVKTAMSLSPREAVRTPTSAMRGPGSGRAGR